MNDSDLKAVEIDAVEAAHYIDDYLFDMLRHDGQDDKNFFVDKTHNIAIKKGDETVGVIAYTLNGNSPFIHPRIRKEHIVYASRCCEMGLDYLKCMGFEIVFAAIPNVRKRTMRMAESFGMKKISTKDCSSTINNSPFKWVIYERAL